MLTLGCVARDVEAVDVRPGSELDGRLAEQRTIGLFGEVEGGDLRADCRWAWRGAATDEGHSYVSFRGVTGWQPAAGQGVSVRWGLGSGLVPLITRRPGERWNEPNGPTQSRPLAGWPVARVSVEQDGRYEIFACSFPLSGAGEIHHRSRRHAPDLVAGRQVAVEPGVESGEVVSINGIQITPGPPPSWGAPAEIIKGPYVGGYRYRVTDVFGDRFLLMKTSSRTGRSPTMRSSSRKTTRFAELSTRALW